MFATLFAILILVLAGWAIAKNYDAKVVLFAAGFLLMYAALIMGSDVLAGKDASGLAWADPFKAVKDLFIKQRGSHHPDAFRLCCLHVQNRRQRQGD